MILNYFPITERRNWPRMCNRSLPSIFDPPENLFQKTAKKNQKNQRNQPRGSIRIQHPIQSVSIIHPNQHLSRLTSPQKVRPPSELQPGSGVRPRGLHPGSVHPSVRASPRFRPSVRRGFTRVSGVRPLRLAGGNQNRPWGWT